MDGMLSQDEINALLQGMDLSDTADGGAAPRPLRQAVSTCCPRCCACCSPS